MSLFWVVLGFSLGVFSARFNWWRSRVKDGIPVLMYHNIDFLPSYATKTERILTVDPDTFRKQMRFLKEQGYRSVTFKDLSYGEELPEKPVVITFDDAYKGVSRFAQGILEEFSFRGVCFVPTAYIGGRKDEIPSHLLFDVMDERELEQWKQGNHELGSHTHRHRNLTELSEEEMGEELEKSRRILQQIGNETIVSFSFPFGRWDQRTLARVQQEGYRFVCIIDRRIADKSLSPPIPRVYIRGDDLFWDFHLNITRGCSRL